MNSFYHVSFGLRCNLIQFLGIFESDKIVVIHYPNSNAPFHEVVFPKKDIRDISQLTDDDQEYVWAALTYISERVKQNKLTKYRVVTNGPYFQQITYLHFHLIDFSTSTTTSIKTPLL